MLGGTIWKIVKVIIIILIIFIFLIINIKTSCQDGEEIKVYAVDYNHKNERVTLRGSVDLGDLK